MTTNEKSFPTPLNVDWEAARIAFIQPNSSPSKIAQSLGIKVDTLQKRAQRERWKPVKNPRVSATLKRTVQAAVHASVSSVLNDCLKDRQEAWKTRELLAAGKLVDTVQARQLDNAPARDVSSLASALDSASRVGRRALDLDTEQQLTAFAAGLCGGARLARPEQLAEREAQVIDVSTNPPVEPQA